MGTKTIPRGTDVQAGIEMIRQAHRNKSVICNGINGVRKVRVRNCSPKEWRAMIHEANNKRLRVTNQPA